MSRRAGPDDLRLVSVRLPAADLERIDGSGEGRTGFIRRAVSEALEGRVVKAPVEVVAREAGSGYVPSDLERAVLDVLSVRAMTVGEVARALGWMEGKVLRVERQLVQAGLVDYDGGRMVLRG